MRQACSAKKRIRLAGFTDLPGGHVFENILIRGGARVIADQGVSAMGLVSLSGGSLLTHSAGNEAGTPHSSRNSLKIEECERDRMVSGCGYAGVRLWNESGRERSVSS